MLLQALAVALHRVHARANLDKCRQLVSNDSTPAQPWWRVQDGGLRQAGELVRTRLLNTKDNTGVLGVTIDPRASMHQQRRQVAAAVCTQLARTGGAAACHGVFSPRHARFNLQSAYAKMLYACEVWSDTGQGAHTKLNTAMAQAAARALEAQGAPHLFTLGEMGLMTATAKHYQQRLAYWMQLVITPTIEYTNYAYRASLATLQAGCTSASWCKETRTMLAHMATGDGDGAAKAGQAWCNGDVEAQRAWVATQYEEAAGDNLPSEEQLCDYDTILGVRTTVRQIAKNIVFDWAQEQWRKDVRSTNSLKDLYPYLHPNLEFARYLDAAHPPQATRLRVQLRSGRYPLAASRAYQLAGHSRAGTVYRRNAKCKLCRDGPAEDVEHFVLHCEALTGVRGDVAARLRAVCKYPAVLALLDPTHPKHSNALLLMVLGGNLAPMDAQLAAWHEARGAAMKDGTPPKPHPCLDRLATLKESGSMLLDLEKERTRLLEAQTEDNSA